MIHLKSLGIGKNTSGDVADSKEDHFTINYAINLFVLIVLFPKCVTHKSM